MAIRDKVTNGLEAAGVIIAGCKNVQGVVHIHNLEVFFLAGEKGCMIMEVYTNYENNAQTKIQYAIVTGDDIIRIVVQFLNSADGETKAIKIPHYRPVCQV